MVEVTRFELATPSSRTMCATKLRYTSIKTAPITRGYIGWGIGIRTPTNRVRVCRATVTLFLNVYCLLLTALQSTMYIIYHLVWFVNTFLKIFFKFSKVSNWFTSAHCEHPRKQRYLLYSTESVLSTLFCNFLKIFQKVFKKAKIAR